MRGPGLPFFSKGRNVTTMQITLDPVALREATGQAIMGILTPELRAQILQQAISALLAPSTNSWERGKSPIEQAFENAVGRAAHEAAFEYVKTDAVLMDRIKALLQQTADKVLAADPEKMAGRMADAFVSSMRREN